MLRNNLINQKIKEILKRVRNGIFCQKKKEILYITSKNFDKKLCRE